MPHGRGQVAYYELGPAPATGAITGLRARVVGDAGAYAGFGGALTLGPTYVMSQGVYAIPKLAFDGAVALTNTTPMGAFRGAGRPEAAAHLERMLDMAADELGMDPAELRRAQLPRPGRRSRSRRCRGPRYDVGDYDLPLREALRLADYDKLREEQALPPRGGRPGRSWGSGSRCTSRSPRAAAERVRLGHACTPTARPTVSAGTSAHGQGHATAFAMLAPTGSASRWRRSPSCSRTPPPCRAAGAPAARGRCRWAATRVLVAADDVLEQARRRAAELLEAAVDDVAHRPRTGSSA